MVADIAFHKGDLVENLGNVLFRASGKVVEDCDAITTGDEGISKVRADETGTTGDESAHGCESIFYLSLLSAGSGYMQVVLRKVGEASCMKSTGATFRKYSSAGVDWASWFLGIGLGLTLALQVTTMRKSDISSVYAVVASVSRLAALTGTFFAVVGIFLIARIPWVERGVGLMRRSGLGE